MKDNRTIVITILIAAITFFVGITISSLAVRDDVIINKIKISGFEENIKTTNDYLRAIIEQNNLILLKMNIEPVRVGKG